MQETSMPILNSVVFGYNLRDILMIISIFLSLTALVLSLFKINNKVDNYFKRKKVNTLINSLLVKLLCAIYYNKDKLSKENNFPELKLNDNDFVLKFKDLFIMSREIRLNTFNNSKILKEYQQLEYIYNICSLAGENIIKQLLFNGYGSLSSHTIDELEKSLEQYLKSISNKRYTPSNILSYV